MRILTFLAPLLLLAMSVVSAAPVQLILDTDLGNDIDDTLALAMIHALENRGEVHLLCVTTTKDNRYAAPFINLMNTFYGRPDIPIGVVHGGKTPDTTAMTQVPAERRTSTGQSVYPHRLESGADAPEAVALLQKVLAVQPDNSVTIAQIGFSTNLARLLQAPEGPALIKRKVKSLYLMAGNFARLEPEYNIMNDAPAARTLLADWPTPMIFSGFEVGEQIKYPYRSLNTDFRYTENHPVAEAYRIFVKNEESRANYDSTAVLAAIRPDADYFDLSVPGTVRLGEKDVTVFTPDPSGRCRYLAVRPEQVGRVEGTMTTLVSEPPQRPPSPTVSPAG